MDANAAGIIGLLLGGAGGYYSGKKRADRKASDLEKLIAMYSGKTDEDITGLPSGTNSGLNIGHPGYETGYIGGFDPQIDISDLYSNTEAVVPTTTEATEKSIKQIILDYLGGIEAANIPAAPFPNASFNEGGVVPKRGLVDEPGGYAGDDIKARLKRMLNPLKLEGMFAYPTLYQLADYGVSLKDGVSGLGFFDQGGRVGYEQGGIVDLYKKMNHE